MCLRSCHETTGTLARRVAGLRCLVTAVWRSIGELVRIANIKSFAPVNLACFRHSSIAACAIGPIETSRFDLGVFGLPSFPSYEASSTIKRPPSGLARHGNADSSPRRKPPSTATVTMVLYGCCRASTSLWNSAGAKITLGRTNSRGGSRSLPRAGFEPARIHPHSSVAVRSPLSRARKSRTDSDESCLLNLYRQGNRLNQSFTFAFTNSSS